MTTRREFTQALAAAALSAPHKPVHRGPLGVQLYTVRDAMARDVPGTLARVRSIGYREVEFAGYFGLRPAAIRRALADAGLRAPSCHLKPADFTTGRAAAIE